MIVRMKYTRNVVLSLMKWKQELWWVSYIYTIKDTRNQAYSNRDSSVNWACRKTWKIVYMDKKWTHLSFS